MWLRGQGLPTAPDEAQIQSQAAQSLPVLQLIARGDPPGRHDVRAVSAVAAQCRGPGFNSERPFVDRQTFKVRRSAAMVEWKSRAA